LSGTKAYAKSSPAKELGFFLSHKCLQDGTIPAGQHRLKRQCLKAEKIEKLYVSLK